VENKNDRDVRLTKTGSDFTLLELQVRVKKIIHHSRYSEILHLLRCGQLAV